MNIEALTDVSMIENAYVIDDDRISMFLTEFTLEGFSENLSCYYSAEVALAAIVEAERHSVEPFVIFLDLNMPNLSGWDFLQAASLQDAVFRARCKVVILSSSIDEEEVRRSKDYPMVLNFISKPLDDNSLALVQKQLLQ